ncbi:MAG: homoserine kinase [Parachlamydiaceae bacterium]|nr:homoserine kinase [Parachlamydiaceae bacterium]
MKGEIRVFAPATVANVASGFDIFGFALEMPGDEVIARLSEHPGVTMAKVSGDGGVLSLDPKKNTAGVSVLKLLEFLNCDHGVELELHKKMPLGSGLGSSAASAAGSVFAVNALLGSPLTSKELIPFAMEAERIACGSAHADNVAPSLLGGFILVRSYQPLDIVEIPINLNLYCSVLHPKIEIRTESARQILRKEISLNQMVIQSGNAAGLIAGLFSGDASLIGRSLNDVVVEPVRARLIPGFYDIQSAALYAGALGCSISGSGPSVFALTQKKSQAENVGEAMVSACRAKGLDCNLYVSSINKKGPRIL